jgi:hypothetical protein
MTTLTASDRARLERASALMAEAQEIIADILGRDIAERPPQISTERPQAAQLPAHESLREIGRETLKLFR